MKHPMSRQMVFCVLHVLNSDVVQEFSQHVSGERVRCTSGIS